MADTSHVHDGIGGPAPMSHALAPGSSIEIGSLDAPIMWAGPLTVVPFCQGDMASLANAPKVTVFTQGPAPSAQTAVDDAVQASAGVFSDCHPSATSSVVGVAHSPNGRTVSARCQAAVQSLPGFDVVTLAAIAPPDASGVDVAGLSQELGYGVPIHLSGPAAVSWWTYVVTPTKSTLVKQFSAYTDCGGSSGSGGGLLDCPV